MNKILIAGLLSVALFMASCHSSDTEKSGSTGKDTSYAIIGKITGQDTGLVYIIHQQTNLRDTARLDHGYFTFKGKADSPEHALIGFYEKDNPYNEKDFFLENGKLSMLIKKDSLQDALISGTPTQDEFTRFENVTEKDYHNKLLAIDKLYREARDKKDKKTMDRLDGMADSLNAEHKKIVAAYVKQHPASYVSAYEISRNFSYNPDPDQLDSLYAVLEPSVKAGHYGRLVHELLKKARLTAIGQPAPLFTAPDSSGKPVSLASFKGRYVLLDFWASWCGPCRRENPAVVKAFHQFHDKGFDILGVSLDDSKDEWEQAIKKDGLNWTQVSDLKGWKADACTLYGIQGIPMNFLLDKDGKIIGKELRGEALIKKLQEILP